MNDPMDERDSASTALLRRGFLLEYVTLGWNVVGVVVVLYAALGANSVALTGFGLDSLMGAPIAPERYS